MIEAKVGNVELTNQQVEGYIDVAKQNGVDALITISNQFASLPHHHPLRVSGSGRRKVELYHWSWMYILTQAHLLSSDDTIEDSEQKFLLNELIRFLSHPSAGVKGFDQMPAEWSPAVTKVLAGGELSATSDETATIAAAWLQEIKDLNLILSRQLEAPVSLRISRAHAADPVERLKETASNLAKEKRLEAAFVVPNAAGPMQFCADIQTRTVSVSMRLIAPKEKKSTKARLNWLLRQLRKSDANNVHVRLFWPGRTPATQFPLAELRTAPELAEQDRQSQSVQSFEVLLVKDLGGRFGQRRNFISDLEQAVPEYYERVGQHLKEWQAPPPKLREDLSAVAQVSPEVIRQEAEQIAEEGP